MSSLEESQFTITYHGYPVVRASLRMLSHHIANTTVPYPFAAHKLSDDEPFHIPDIKKLIISGATGYNAVRLPNSELIETVTSPSHSFYDKSAAFPAGRMVETLAIWRLVDGLIIGKPTVSTLVYAVGEHQLIVCKTAYDGKWITPPCIAKICLDAKPLSVLTSYSDW
jgi:hypothetical protein